MVEMLSDLNTASLSPYLHDRKLHVRTNVMSVCVCVCPCAPPRTVRLVPPMHAPAEECVAKEQLNFAVVVVGAVGHFGETHGNPFVHLWPERDHRVIA